MTTRDSDATKTLDDLEAVRAIVTALSGFTRDEQERIMRWSREKLGLMEESIESQHKPAAVAEIASSSLNPGDRAPDVKTFVNSKRPQRDTYLAATIAYYYRFVAPANLRREQIDADFLRDACRLAGRPGQLTKPLKTLHNAVATGLMDNTGRGLFAINTVGENLVGMTLPAENGVIAKRAKKKNTGNRKLSRTRKKV